MAATGSCLWASSEARSSQPSQVGSRVTPSALMVLGRKRGSIRDSSLPSGKRASIEIGIGQAVGLEPGSGSFASGVGGVLLARETLDQRRGEVAKCARHEISGAHEVGHAWNVSEGAVT